MMGFSLPHTSVVLFVADLSFNSQTLCGFFSGNFQGAGADGSLIVPAVGVVLAYITARLFRR